MRISVSGGGSGVGLTALINGTVDIANASRQIKPEEAEQAQAHGITRPNSSSPVTPSPSSSTPTTRSAG